MALALLGWPSPVHAAGAPGAVHISWSAAAAIAFCYYLSQSAWLAGLGFWTLYRPLVGGALVGIILGDPWAGARVGAAINLAYLGFLATGGALPSDISLAGYLGATLVLAGGLDVSTALALTVPAGLLGYLIYQARMTLDVVFVHWADRYAARGDARGVAFCNVWPPQVALLALSLLPCMLGVYYGPAWLGDLLSRLPPWLLPALQLAGGLLPALGIALNLHLLWRGANGAYFLLGFLFATWTPAPLLTLALLAAALAFIQLRRQPDDAPQPPAREPPHPNPERPDPEPGPEGRHPDGPLQPPEREPPHPNPERPDPEPGPERRHPDGPLQPPVHDPPLCQPPLLDSERRPERRHPDGLRRRDLWASWLTWLFFSHACYNYERFQGAGFAHSLLPVLTRLYPRRADLAAAMQRHMLYYNSEPNVGALTNGVIVALEERQARDGSVGEAAIHGLKASLMGPLSGLGDTLLQGALAPLLLGLGIDLARTGGLLGPLVYVLLITAVIWGVGWGLFLRGYRGGSAFVARLLQGGDWRRVLAGIEAVGSAVLGVLAARLIVLRTPLALHVGASTLRLQEDLLDKLLPQLLPLLLVLLYLALLRRRASPLWLALGTLLGGLLARLAGIL